MNLAVRYVIFALLATGANLAVQEGAIRIGAGLGASILAGTVAGFALKYALDKRWIFFDPYEGRGDEVRKVSLYGLFSVLTTLIFWGTELLFWHVWKTDLAKYAGASIGLAAGYAIKFALDRRITFREQRA